MTDNVNVASDRPRRSEPAEVEAGLRLVQDAYAARPVTNLNGELCRTQPKPDEFSAMSPRVVTRGCDYQSGAQLSAATGTLDFGNIWNQVQHSTVRVQSGTDRHPEGSGSGVVIGRHNDLCIVATAAHVTHPNRFGMESEPSTNRSVTMPDGRTYPAETRIRNERNDQSILTVRTGDRTDQICHPVQAAEGYAGRQRGFIAGFPAGATTPYISPAEGGGIRRDLGRPDGRHMDAPQYRLRTNITGGNSGGPWFNGRGEVMGLVSSGNERRPGQSISANDEAFLSPLTATMQRRYVETIRGQR